ncbi:MAG: branched-chain amino acid ABC transporter permease [Alphaproteobacteria bacterium]|nr:MAG: branched-chain amino acid ABC transporter permease [Alphaproteobacteria bacterium]
MSRRRAAVDLNFLFINILNGVVYGAFLLLTSLGLSLVFGLGRVVNFAHGALYAMGGYALIAVMHAGGAGYWLALVAAPLLVIPIAIVIERATIDPIRHRPDVDTLLVTFGLSSIIVGAIEYVWGTGTTLLPAPAPFAGTVNVLGNQYPLYRLIAALVSLLVSVGVFATIAFTPVGLRIRAITDDAGMAQALGVNIKRLLTLVFGFAAGLAALAGALAAPIFAIHPEMGMNILIDSFLVVVLGGLGSLTGSAIGAFFVALTKSLGGGYFAEWSTAFLFLIVAAALIVRPTGVFGRGRVA